LGTSVGFRTALSLGLGRDGRLDRRLSIRPEGLHVRTDGNGDRSAADRDHCQGDAVLGEVLTTVLTDELVYESEHFEPPSFCVIPNYASAVTADWTAVWAFNQR